MPVLETKGAISAQGFGLTLGAAEPIYIEDVFSTWLYTGADSSTITNNNGIDLTGKGGLVWIKTRSGNGGAQNHALFDTVRGSRPYLSSNTTTAQTDTNGASDFAFLSSGFQVGPRNGTDFINASSTNFTSWTFREQPKFFDVVTYTGNGTTNNVSHALASAPGFILIKKTSGTGDWIALCRKNDTQGVGLYLNTAATNYYDGDWPFGIPPADANTLRVSWINDQIVGGCNDNGATYVAYLFAHNAGGFGLTGTDNVISCGSFTTDGSGNATVSLGYEPQWLMVKKITGPAENWIVVDTMRGWTVRNSDDAVLNPNTNFTENDTDTIGFPTATGFQYTLGSTSRPYIYIAIRRGPMKVPTTGTSVYTPFYANYSEGAALTTNFPIDLSMWKANTDYNWSWQDRLRGWPKSSGSGGPALASNTSGAETTAYQNVGAARFDSNTGAVVTYQADSGRSNQAAYFMFRRAPGFFDVVCYTGNGSTQNVTHNLGVAPELMFIKERNGSTDWRVYIGSQGNQWVSYLNLSYQGDSGQSVWNSTTPTSTVFSLGVDNSANGSGDTYVNYLFATCPGVSKVGSYTGNGSTQVINCGFTTSSRFVMIKRTDSGGSWHVYSTALGITAGTDSAVFFNSLTGVSSFGDTLDANSTGFELGPDSSSGGLNASGGTYLFLAIA
jgi:hypothetical protein